MRPVPEVHHKQLVRRELTHLSLLAGSATRESAPRLHRGQKVCHTAATFWLRFKSRSDPVARLCSFGRTPRILRPPILLLNIVLLRGLVWPTGTLENLFLYLSASATDFSRKMADLSVELRKSG